MDIDFILLLPVIGGAVYWLATNLCMAFFTLSPKGGEGGVRGLKISLIKPVYGLEKNLYENLRSACEQDYPDYEVVFGLQDENDPALPIVEKIRNEFPQRVQIVVDTNAVGPNGRLCNIYNASKKATGEILLFSDSDVFLPADYLRAIIAPFADPQVGVSCTLYKAWRPHNIAERLELLSLNTDFIPSMVFAYVTKMTIACPGASQAIRRSVLEEIGGLKPLADYLVEDFELGRRVREKGYKIHFVPFSIPTEVNLGGFQDWWRHQVYWDHNTRAANASGFLATVLIRAIPFALFYWLVDGEMAIPVLVAIIFWRIYTAVFNAFFLKDPDTIRSLWLLPIRDLLAFCTWAASFMKKNIYWKGREFEIRDGRMIESSNRHSR